MSSPNEPQKDVTVYISDYSNATSEQRLDFVRKVEAEATASEEFADGAVDVLQQIAYRVPVSTLSEAYAINSAIASIKKKKSIPELIDLLIKNLDGSRTPEIRVAAAQELENLGQKADKALPALMKCVLAGERLSVDLHIYAFRAITAIGSSKDVKQLVVSEMQPPGRYGLFLLGNDDGRDVLGYIWDDNPELALRYVVAALSPKSGDVRPREAAAWLRERAPAIPENNKIPEPLKKQLVDQLKSWNLLENEPKVQQLLEDTLSLLEGLTAIQKWIEWIEVGDPTSLVQAETQAEQMRSDPNSVRYLVSEFEKKNRESNGLGEILVEASAKMELELLQRRLRTPESLTKSENERLDRWLADLATQFDDFAKVKEEGVTQGMITCLYRERDAYKTNLRVRQRIVRQLTEMSDYPRFFEGKRYQGERKDTDDRYRHSEDRSAEQRDEWDLAAYDSIIRQQLQKHVVPVFGRRLPKESDENIRANMTRTLANIGGRESVETLVQAIIGEERKQDRRQALLDEYYLQPSRDRGEEAARMLGDALGDAKSTMKILQILNAALFAVGIGLIIYSFWLLTDRTLEQTKLVGPALSALGGFAAIYTSFITNPLDGIQNAMSRLVQLETAFTSFVWDLNLNSTYIQSQYVAKGILSDDDIARTVGRIQDAMSLTLNMVQTYAVQQVQLKETLIYSLSSEQIERNTVISLFGKYLRGESYKILVNHKPLEAQADRWTDSEVRFTLPAPVASEGADIWVSLLIDGKETNAMACKVGRSDTSSPADASTSKSGSASITFF